MSGKQVIAFSVLIGVAVYLLLSVGTHEGPKEEPLREAFMEAALTRAIDHLIYTQDSYGICYAHYRRGRLVYFTAVDCMAVGLTPPGNSTKQ